MTRHKLRNKGEYAESAQREREPSKIREKKFLTGYELAFGKKKAREKGRGLLLTKSLKEG